MSNQHSGFGKVHEKMFSSSIMRADVETRWVFVFLFSCCGSDGRYVGDSFAIARHANVSEEAASKALAELAAPDEKSSSPDFEGRRIEDVSDGRTGSVWLVLNHKKYRARRDPFDRASYNAAYYREKTKAKRARGSRQNASVKFNRSQKSVKKADAPDASSGTHAEAQQSGVNVSNGVRPIKPIAEAEARERGSALSGAVFQTPGPTHEEWGERAEREHPDWPDSDVKRALRIATGAKGWPKGWEGRQDTLYERYVDHSKGTAKTPSPHDREKDEIKRTIQKARGIHIPASQGQPRA